MKSIFKQQAVIKKDKSQQHARFSNHNTAIYLFFKQQLPRYVPMKAMIPYFVLSTKVYIYPGINFYFASKIDRSDNFNLEPNMAFQLSEINY